MSNIGIIYWVEEIRRWIGGVRLRILFCRCYVWDVCKIFKGYVELVVRYRSLEFKRGYDC